MSPDGRRPTSPGRPSAASVQRGRRRRARPGRRRDPRLQATTPQRQGEARRRDRRCRRRRARRRRRTSRRPTRRRCPGRATSRSRRDGKTLLAALNLANAAAIVDTRDAARCATSRPAATPTAPRSRATASSAWSPTRRDGTVSVIDLAAGEKVKDITVGPHLSHPEGIAIDPKRRWPTSRSPTRT